MRFTRVGAILALVFTIAAIVWILMTWGNIIAVLIGLVSYGTGAVVSLFGLRKEGNPPQPLNL